MGLQPDTKISDPGYYEREANQLETRFDGNGAKLLGIHGTFDPAVAGRLFRGMQPDLLDGKEAKLTARIDKDRVGAVDWTFNCPKSVSVAELVAGDARIGDVRTAAEQKAMRLVEKQARVRVRKSAEVAKGKPKTWKYPARYTDNLIWEAYRHPSARDGSPHAHTHFKLYNLSYDRQEGIWKAAELRYVDRKAVNELYRREMRKGLNQLGYKTKAVGQEYEITGVPAEVKGIFSERHAAIEAKQKEMESKIGKPMGSKAKGKLSVYDRPDKPPDMPLEERRKGWKARLSDGQYRGLVGLVRRAKATVSRERWRGQMKNYVQRLQKSVTQERAIEQTTGRER